MFKISSFILLFIGFVAIYKVTTIIAIDGTDFDIQKLKSQYLPANFAKANFTLDDAKMLLRKKCKKVGVENPKVYDEIEAATKKLIECGNNIANFTQILAEIETARPAGELDDVFQKYCEKRPTAEKCLKEFNEHLLPCLTKEEKAQNEVLMRILTSLLGFICYKNGDQIALFIAEEGPECLESQKENIGNCMNASFAAYMPKQENLVQISELPDLVMTPKQCIDLYDFEECVLGYLEKCNEITPANIIESMFKYVKNETKCESEVVKLKHNTASALQFSVLLTTFAISMALMKKINFV